MGVALLPAAALPVCQRGLDQALNRGWARLGRDLNSGWNWPATKKSFWGSSTVSTMRPSGLVPLMTMPAASTVSR